MYGTSQNSFADLMSMAKQNAAEARKKTANLSNSDGRPRKADPKQVKLKEGVQKFLQKQAEEEKRRKELENLKKEKLLQLRQQDRKATNRVRKMLSMTKSANKSCVDDAKDCLNESVAAQGEIQPDEDDYGYTSSYSDLMHKQMMEKYKTIPVKPAFPQERTAVPVPKHQSLTKNGTGWRKNGHSNEEDRGYSSPEQERYEEPPPTKSRKPEKPSKPNRPPPPDYRVLLQMAQEKKFEPPVPTKPVIDKKRELEDFEFGRPMTAKEKKAYLEQKEIKDRVARRMADKNNNSSNGSSSSSSIDNKNGKMPSFKIPKARSNNEEPIAAPPPKKPRVVEPEPTPSSRPAKEVPKPPRHNETNGNSSSYKSSSMPTNKPNGIRPSSSSSSNGNNGILSRALQKPEKSSNVSSSSPPSHSSKPKGDSHRDRDRPLNGTHPTKSDSRSEKIQEIKELIKEKPRYLSAIDSRVEKKQPLLSKDSNKPKPGSSREMYASSRDEKTYDSRDKVRPPQKMPQQDRNDRNRPISKERERNDMGPPPRRDGGAPPRRDVGPPPRRDMGPPPRRDMAPAPRRNGANTPPRREMSMKGPSRMRDEPPSRMRPPNHKPFKGRAVIDSDEEYDSEMDDFIDDSEVDMGNISAEISRIFKYDRRKYNYEDSDDECMESSVAQQFAEESRSLRIAIQEDLEEERKEAEEKRRMAMAKKKR